MTALEDGAAGAYVGSTADAQSLHVADAIAAAIAALEAQRGALGDEAADLAIASLRQRLTAPDDAAPDPADSRLKQATLLFADTVGSTALIRHLDPEDASTLMDGMLRRMSEVVAMRQGRVLQYTGDGLLAAFGADTSHEDDPENAVLAGLDIVQTAREVAQELRQQHGIEGFDVRVGIHTGPVLLGGGVDGENSVRGNSVNIAARMEQTAPAGAVRISRDTQRHVRGLFDAAEQPPLAVKGLVQPLVTYLVQRALPRRFGLAHRGVSGVETRLIDRIDEMARLQAAYRALCGEATVSGNGGQHHGAALIAITVVAEAGLGKTRLLAEFADWAAAQPRGMRALRARASERRAGQPYGVLRDLLTSPLPLLDSDPAPSARATWLAAMTPLLGSSTDAAVLGHLIGLDFSAHEGVRGIVGEGRQIRDRGYHYAAQALRRMAADGPPVLLFFDDLHWADDGSLDFIQHLQSTHADLPVLLAGLTRPTLYERRPNWDSLQGPRSRIDLPQLAPHDSVALARELLQRVADVPDALRELITSGAEGNPYYMEELVNMLIDRGAIEASESWQVRPDKLQALTVPGTLTGVLQARLDALSPALRRTLQQAAVIGPVFWDDALAALDGTATSAGVQLQKQEPSAELHRQEPSNAPHRRDAALAALMARELIFAHEPSSLAGLREYRFKHHTLHQVCYDSVLKQPKRAAHQAIADWLAAQPGATRLDQIAEHYERGGDAAQAVTYWQRAAEAAAGGYANAAALAHADRALALIGGNLDGEAEPHALAQRFALTLLCVKVLRTQSDRARLAPRLAELEALAEQLNDDGLRSEAAERRARFLDDGGEMAAAVPIAMQALAWAPSSMPVRAARAHALLAASLSKLDRSEEALRHASAGLSLAREAGDSAVEAIILNWMGMDAVDRGDPGAAIPLFERALACHRSTADRSNEAGTLCNLAYAGLTLGDYEPAYAQFLDAAKLCRQTGQRQSEGIIQINLALVLLCQSEAEAALACARASLHLLGLAGDRWAQAAALRVVGHAQLALGQHELAVADFTASRNLFDELGLGHLAIEAMAGLAKESLSRHCVDEARVQVDLILERQAAGAGLAGTDEPLRIGLVCCEVLIAAKDPRAESVLELTHAELQRRAAKISDPLRRLGFLEQVPYHRELVRLWAQRPA
ncbi:adenylate/guanylate cyclase domain-containing protein [soil metagenome]